jgi:DNA-directed RNA polymerase specialized sigma24 family protein
MPLANAWPAGEGCAMVPTMSPDEDFERSRRRLIAFFRRAGCGNDAEDLAQEVLIRQFKSPAVPLLIIAKSVLIDWLRRAPRAVHRTRAYRTTACAVSHGGQVRIIYDGSETDVDLSARNDLVGLEARIREVHPRLKCVLKEMEESWLLEVTIWGAYPFALLDCIAPQRWKPLITLFKYIPRLESLQDPGPEDDSPGYDPPAAVEPDPYESALIVPRVRDALLAIPPRLGEAILEAHVAAARRVAPAVRNECLFRSKLQNQRLADIATRMGIGIAEVSKNATLGYAIAAVAFHEQCGRRPTDQEMHELLASLQAGYPEDFPWYKESTT